MKNLEERLEEKFSELNIAPIQKYKLTTYLALLKNKDEKTYEHSIRVGMLGAEVAKFIKVEPKILFYAGLFHDIGKIMVDDKSLKKSGRKFSKKDFEKIKKHPEFGYNIIKDVYSLSAEIIIRHHQYGKTPYPEKLPELNKKFSPETKAKICYCSRLLSLIDFYDAITTRKDKKHSRNLTGEEIKKEITKENKDLEILINSLYRAKIFKT